MAGPSLRARVAHFWVPCALSLAAIALKNVPRVGATPWIAAGADALALFFLLRVGRKPPAFLLCVLLPWLDWAQGSLIGFQTPFVFAGLLAALLLSAAPITSGWLKALAVGVACSLPVLCGTALGYVFLRDLAVGDALRTAFRSRWYLPIWNVAACAAAAYMAARVRRAGTVPR